jgi:hypothetical protein
MHARMTILAISNVRPAWLVEEENSLGALS